MACFIYECDGWIYCLPQMAKDLGITWVVVLVVGFFVWSMPYQLSLQFYPQIYLFFYLNVFYCYYIFIKSLPTLLHFTWTIWTGHNTHTCKLIQNLRQNKITKIQLMSGFTLVLDGPRNVCTRRQVCLDVDGIWNFVVDRLAGRLVLVQLLFRSIDGRLGTRSLPELIWKIQSVEN